MLNVNLQPGGSAVFKRDGYGLFQTLSTAYPTQAVHGGYHFQQLGGNDVQVWASSTTLYASVNDANFVSIATGTFGATWQCTDSQGKAYCFDSSGDTPVQTDGTTANTIYFSSAPSGTMATFTPLQLVVSGVSGNANTIYISGQLAFNNFTPGILPSSPFIEPIASPGSRITHLAYYFGRLFWWKDQSFGYATFTGQNDWQLTIVSNQIGTLDNSDAFWNSSGFDAGTMFSGIQQANANTSPGGIFFRGQDNHLYVYDGYYLTRLSRIITPTITAANRKKSDAWTQTTQADWQTGSIIPPQNLSTLISPGDVIVSSFQAIEQSNTQWNNGIAVNTTINQSSITLNTNNAGNLTNPDFESSFTGNWNDPSNSWQQKTATVENCGTINPQTGSEMIASAGGTAGLPETIDAFEMIDLNGNIISSTSFIANSLCTWTQYTLSSSAIGKRVKFRFHMQLNSVDHYLTTSDSYISGGNVTFWANAGTVGSIPNVVTRRFADNVQLGSSTLTGFFNSQVYNLGFTSSTVQLQAVFASTESATFNLQTSTSSTGSWSIILNSTGTNAIANQYVKYSSTLTATIFDLSVPFISTVTIISQSTGTFYSAVKNAPSLTSWNTFTADDIYPGISSITYYMRASTNSFSVLSSTPIWIFQPKNATVTASTGTFMQVRADFYLSAATETPMLNDFTINWFEGFASDKAYITYFNDAIWFSVSSSSLSSTNNAIFYWDLLNGAWCLYDIKANGFLVENNSLYFGDPNSSNVYKFGGVTTDNSANINSYWRSKSFLFNETENSGNGQSISFPATDDIFVQKQFTQADFVLGESSTTLSYTYTLDSKTSTVFMMTAFDSSSSLIQRNFLLPIGKIGKYYDFKIGDNSSQAPWKMIAHRVHYDPLNWRPVLQ